MGWVICSTTVLISLLLLWLITTPAAENSTYLSACSSEGQKEEISNFGLRSSFLHGWGRMCLWGGSFLGFLAFLKI